MANVYKNQYIQTLLGCIYFTIY